MSELVLKKIAFGGKSAEFTMSDVKVVPATDGNARLIQLQTNQGGFVVDEHLLEELFNLVKRRGSARQVVHGWEVKIVSRDSINNQVVAPMDNLRTGVAALGYVISNGVTFLVLDMIRNDNQPSALYVVDFLLFLTVGGSISPATYYNLQKVCNGWISGVVTHGIDRVRYLTQAYARTNGYLYEALYNDGRVWSGLLRGNVPLISRGWHVDTRMKTPLLPESVQMVGERPVLRTARETSSVDMNIPVLE